MRVLRYGLAALFVAAGVLHFVRPEAYLKIMPPFVPWPRAAVLVSGIAEVAGGLGLLWPRTRRMAAWGLVALLVAVFPANVHMALHPADVAPGVPVWLLWARLPLQPLLVWGVWKVRGPRSEVQEGERSEGREGEERRVA
jgi:uncharacterized membrane protein